MKFKAIKLASFFQMSRYFLLRKISLCFSQQFKCVCNSRAKFAESFHQMSNLTKGNQTFSLNMLVYEIQSFETRARSLNPAKSVVAVVVVSWRRTVWPAFLPKACCTCALISFLPVFPVPHHMLVSMVETWQEKSRFIMFDYRTSSTTVTIRLYCGCQTL